MRFLEALRNAVQRLEADLADSELFDHMGDRGEFRERIVEAFLRPYLPKCYGLGSGAVFSSNGAGSRQMDVVIFDDVFSNVLFRSSSNSLFPCESVFGAIEVKSQLTSSELDVSISNIKSLKVLEREPSDMCDVLPFRRLGVGGGLNYDQRVRNHYLGFVFAYDGLTADTAEDALNHQVNMLGEGKRDLPDFLFNYRRGYMVYRIRRSGNSMVPAVPGEEFEQFHALHIAQDTLPLFFLTVNICLNNTILRSPDLNAYWIQMFSESLRNS